MFFFDSLLDWAERLPFHALQIKIRCCQPSCRRPRPRLWQTAVCGAQDCHVDCFRIDADAFQFDGMADGLGSLMRAGSPTIREPGHSSPSRMGAMYWFGGRGLLALDGERGLRAAQ